MAERDPGILTYTRAEAKGADIAKVAAKVEPTAMKTALASKLKVSEADIDTPPVQVSTWDTHPKKNIAGCRITFLV